MERTRKLCRGGGGGLKLGEDTKRLHTTVEIFDNWLANGSPPWPAYHAFMSGRLIALDKSLACVRSVLKKPGDVFLLIF